MNQPSQRLQSLQMLRGIAALLVVVVHAINVSDFRSDLGYSWLGSAFALNEFGATGVDLFFVISGFVMAFALTQAPDTPPKTFIRQRLIRVLPPFWLLALGYTALRFMLELPLDSKEILTAITLVPLADGAHYVTPILIVGWSLAFELIFYSLVAASLYAAPAWRMRALLVTLFICGTIGAIFPPAIGIVKLIFNPIIFEFGLGIAVFCLWQSQMISLHAARCLGGLGCFMLLLTAFHGFSFQTPHLPLVAGETGLLRTFSWGVPWAAIVLAAVETDSAQTTTATPSPLKSALLALGNASYSLYLAHMFVMLAAQTLWEPGWVTADIMISLLVGLAVLAGIGCYRWIERPLLLSMRHAKTSAALRMIPTVSAY